jgi:hypothetical protein
MSMNMTIKNSLKPIQRALSSKKAVVSSLCLVAMLAGSMMAPFAQTAEARHRYDDRYDRDYGYRGGDQPLFGYKTGKILKGGLIGAGVGAGSAIVFDKPMLKSSVLGAGIGAGVQAIRYW